MRILGSTTLPLKFPAETRIRKITFRVVDGLPYGLIVGADYLRSEENILDFGPGKGFKHNPNAAWIPFLDHTPPSALIASLTDSLATTAVDATHRASQSLEDMAWDDDSTLEWDVYLNNGDTSTEGYVSKVVGGHAVGPMPQDKQLLIAIILPQEAYDLGKTAMVGVARGVIWWKPGTPVVCKLVNRSNNYLRKTNICFRFAFGSPCPRHLAGSCPFVHDIIPEGAFATTNPVRRSYGATHARPPRRLFAMTDEAREIPAACGIAPEDSDGQADAE